MSTKNPTDKTVPVFEYEQLREGQLLSHSRFRHERTVVFEGICDALPL